MKTDELISILSTGVKPVRQGAALRRFAGAISITIMGALVIMLMMFGLRPDLHAVISTPLFWGKLAFTMLIAAGAWLAALRFSRPASKMGGAGLLILFPLLVVWMTGAWLLSNALPEVRWTMILGQSWRTCPFNILFLSLPGMAVIFRTIRSLAPTRLRLAGAAGGLLAGAVASVVYCFHCPEMSPAFWGVWYLLGMLLPAVAGALIGPRLLRW